MSRSEVIYFKSYCSDTHTPTILKWSVKIAKNKSYATLYEPYLWIMFSKVTQRTMQFSAE